MNHTLGLVTNGPKEEAPQPGEYLNPLLQCPAGRERRKIYWGLVGYKFQHYTDGLRLFCVACLSIGVVIEWSQTPTVRARLEAVQVKPGFGAYRTLWVREARMPPPLPARGITR
jgi:hypothetical protein